MIKFKGCNGADALIAGTVFRVTFTQTTAQSVGAFFFANAFDSELQAVYQRGGDSNKSPYAFPASQPPTDGGKAVVIDFKVRSSEFHAGTVSDLANSLNELSGYVDVLQVEKPSRQDLGTTGRATALTAATAAGDNEAANSGFFAGLTKTLRDLKTVVIVVAVGAVVVAGAYVVSKASKAAKAVT